MCGRYSLVLVGSQLVRRFGIEQYPADLQPRYNIAPSQQVPIITNTEPKKLTIGQWGFKPSWWGDKLGDGLINAQAEDITAKPTWAAAVRQHRCLIPADSFYEWSGQRRSAKTPYRFRLKNKQFFTMAELYQARRIKNRLVPSFAIITTTANRLVGQIHDRMPVILDRTAEQEWLTDSLSIKKITDNLVGYPADQMMMEKISSRINNARLDDAELVTPAVQEKR